MTANKLKTLLDTWDRQLLKQRKSICTLRTEIESTPSTWISLTTEEVWVIWDAVTETNKDRVNIVLRFAEAIETTLKEKNA